MRAILLCLAAILAPPGAQAAQSAFSTDEAARCGVVFSRMAEALADGTDAPQSLVTQVNVGLPIWEYELIASAPNQNDKLEAAVITAIDKLAASMPQGDGDAAARGDFLLAQAQACGRMIDLAYPDGNHPVVNEIKARMAEANAAQMPVPSPKPDPNAADKPRRRGLR